MLTSVVRLPRDTAVRRQYPDEISELRGGFNRHVNAPDPLLVHPRGQTWNRRPERGVGFPLKTLFPVRGGAPRPFVARPPRVGAARAARGARTPLGLQI